MGTGSEELGGLLCIAFNNELYMSVDNNKLRTGVVFHKSVY